MENWQKEALRRHRTAILDDLYVDYVVDHLYAHQILSEEHIESILSQIGRRKRASCLLDLLPSLGSTAYFEFVNSLKVPYSWLSQILSQESEKTLTNAASTSHYYSNRAIQSQPVCLNSEEFCQELDNLSSVATKCAQSLCALGETVLALGNSLSGANILRKNSINFSMNEEPLAEPSQQVIMDRLRGGGDIANTEEKLYNLNIEEEKVYPVTPLSTANLFDLGKEKFPLKNHDCNELGKTIDQIGDKEQIISSLKANKIMQEAECGQVEVENLANDETDEVDSVGFHSFGNQSYRNGPSVAFAEKFMSSPNGEPLKDSPDSGMGDLRMNEEKERVDSHEIMSPSGTSFVHLNLPSTATDQKSDDNGNLGMPSSLSPKCTSEKYLNLSGLAQVAGELVTLRHEIKDLAGVLGSIVQLLEKINESYR